jgi:hypothetical protein
MATISITLVQTNEVIQDASDGSLTYRVACQITATEGVSLALFVFDVLHQVYNHIATVYDLEHFPESVGDALSQGVDFYRQQEVTRDFTSQHTALDFAKVTRARLRRLAADLPDALETFTGVPTTYVYTSQG